MDKTDIGWRKSFRITRNNKSFYMLVVFLLGMIVITTLFGVILSTLESKSIPDSLVSIGSVAVGALGAIFNKD